MPEADPLRVAILGPLEVSGEVRGPVEVPGRRLRALLIRLALEPGWVVSAERLIDELWREDPPAGAANALQALVSRLRAVIGRGAIESGGGGYRLNLPPEAVDLVRFERDVRAARTDLEAGRPGDAVRRLREALGLWRGSALADIEGEPFADSARAGLEEQRVAAVEDLAEAVLAACATGDVGPLLPELEQLRAAYPLREGLHARYMKVLYAMGRHAEALAAYEQLRQTLADSLGIDPSPEMAKLHLAMLRQDPQLPTFGAASVASAAASAAESTSQASVTEQAGSVPDASAPAGTVPATTVPASAGRPPTAAAPAPLPAHVPRTGNLPAQFTSFIGREAELEHVGHLLADARLVTLIGPGGAGKTRLAQECGARLAEHVSDGVWFVPFAAVADGADVAQAVLTALGGDESAWLTALSIERVERLGPAERVQEMLAGRAPVLILDNCEHVLDDVAELVDRILAASPHARVLATSREPLALTGETLSPVASLDLPPETGTAASAPLASSASLSPSSFSSPPSAAPRLTDGSPAAESALGYAAVRLLAERARAVRPGFLVTAANVAAVTRICRALDGIPLAIELAAARLRSLTAQQVADRLDDRFRLLSSGSRTALPRHQTLRAIVDWSWELLGRAERGALARLSVFAGGATPEAAAKVCDDASPDGVIDVIASLVDKSLVIAQEDEAGEVRYRLLETVRAYAAERLEESGRRADARDAHARHFLALAELADPYLRGREQVHWTVRLNLERDNLTAAVRQVVANEDCTAALRFYQSLTWFWMMRNHESDAAQWAGEIGELIDRVGYEVPAELAEAHQILTGARRISTLVEQQPDSTDAIARTLLEIVPAEAVRARHPLLAMARPMAAIMASRDAGQSLTREDLAPLAEHPDPWVRAVRYAFAGLLDLFNSRPDEGEEMMLRAYQAYADLGERLGLTFTLVILTEFSLAHGRFAEAASRAQAAYGYATEGGLSDDNGAMLLVKVGQSRALAGEVDAGRRMMEQAVTAAERQGQHSEAAAGHSELAALALRVGDRAEARRRLLASTELVETHVKRGRAGLAMSTLLARRAYLAALDGEYETSRGMLRQAVELVRNGPLLAFMAGLDEIIRGLAALAGMEGDHTRAAELLGSAYAVVGMENHASYSDAATRSAALAALGEKAFAKAFERGRNLQQSELLALEP
jgi:predicted ATPase/DNA-binding SARP family transcriptional activator